VAGNTPIRRINEDRLGEAKLHDSCRAFMVAGSVAIGYGQTNETGHSFAPQWPASRRLAQGWLVGPPALAGAPLAAPDS
jgi:hypothetical protein